MCATDCFNWLPPPPSSAAYLPPQVGIMTAVFVVLLTVNLLKGGGAFDSPVGIECGSFAFWATSVLSFVYLIAVSL